MRFKAKALAKGMNIDNFTGNPTWLYRFMCRHDLVLRQKIRPSQKLPEEFEEKVLAFQRTVIHLRQTKEYPLDQIGKMDDTPMQFDMPLDRTLNNKREKNNLNQDIGA